MCPGVSLQKGLFFVPSRGGYASAGEKRVRGGRADCEFGIGEAYKKARPFALQAAKGRATIFGSGLLSHMTLCSIIGEEELNCRVRNGIGCTLFSMAAKKFSI